MPTGRLLRSGKYKKRYAFYASSKDKTEADGMAKSLRVAGRNAVVRRGGTKWDVFVN